MTQLASSGSYGGIGNLVSGEGPGTGGVPAGVDGAGAKRPLRLLSAAGDTIQRGVRLSARAGQ